jgi:hypothetical protein
MLLVRNVFVLPFIPQPAVKQQIEDPAMLKESNKCTTFLPEGLQASGP